MNKKLFLLGLIIYSIFSSNSTDNNRRNWIQYTKNIAADAGVGFFLGTGIKALLVGSLGHDSFMSGVSASLLFAFLGSLSKIN